MAESGPGKIEVFSDFVGEEIPIAGTVAVGQSGPFRVVGDSIEDTDAGLVSLEADGLNGVLQLTSPNADNDSICLTTATMWDVGLMGTIIAETRVRFADLDTKEFFFGFCDLNTDTHSLEAVSMHGATTVLTLTASDICGFILSAELTEDEMWHSIYNGGATTGAVLSTTNETKVNAVAGEFDILRIEMDTNGTARFWVNGDLAQTVKGAVSTTTDLAGQVVLEIKGTGAVETADIDYLLFRGNRDWTR